MKAYKAFNKDLTCTLGKGTFQYEEGKVIREEEAKCARTGLHAASDPLDTLTYYPNMETSVYYVVDARGDINEDGMDSRISCTEMELVRKLDHEEFVYEALLYMAKHPKREINKNVGKETKSGKDIAIARGKNPRAKGKKGCVLGLYQEDENGEAKAVAIYVVDGENIEADTYYNIDGKKVEE